MFGNRKFRVFTMLLAAVLTVAACVSLKLLTGGWEVLALWPIYVVFCAAHVALHFRWARAREPFPPYFFGKALLSHTLFGLAFLMDISDGDSDRKLTIFRLFEKLGVGPPIAGWWYVWQGRWAHGNEGLVHIVQTIFVCAAWALVSDWSLRGLFGGSTKAGYRRGAT